jgi:nucleoside-diphosphate-sugar epimerase
VDLRLPEFSTSDLDDFVVHDLRDARTVQAIMARGFDEVYQLAADMGGAGYIFSGHHDAEIMCNSAMINLNVLRACCSCGVAKIFFASSACVYPLYRQQSTVHPHCAETDAYPAAPEKLFAERLYLAFARTRSIDVRIARFHNVFGPENTWRGGREKAPAAICRKVAETPDGGEIEVWGDGEQTRSFLYIDECIVGVLRLMSSSVREPINIGSSEMVSINQLVRMTMEIAGKQLRIQHIAGPQGVRGRTSDNRLIERALGWRPSAPLRVGLERTYRWVRDQVAATGHSSRPSLPATPPVLASGHDCR